MSEAAKTLRLSKVAKEFNLSLGKIVEFLASKGKSVESNPNAKIGDDEYRLLLKEFSGDKSAKEEAENVLVVMGLLSKYAQDSTMWWEAGKGDPVDSPREKVTVPPSRPLANMGVAKLFIPSTR